MSKIDKLTPQQEIDIISWRKEWFDIGMSTTPADRPLAEKSIIEAYSVIGKPAPKIIWCDSPLTAVLCLDILSKLATTSLDDSLRASLRDSLRAFLHAFLGNSLRASLRDSLGASLGASLRDSLRASLSDSLGASLHASLGASLGGIIAKQEFNNKDINTYWWGQQDAYWICFYLFCAHIGVQYSDENIKKLKIMAAIARSCSWWYPRDGIAFVCERPVICSFSAGEAPVLHSSTGPAAQFRDGFAVYALNGVRVPETVVMTPAEKLAPQLVLTEKNAEVRREIVRKIGMERMILKLGAKVLDKQGDYELLEFDRGDGIKRPYLKMRNPSIKTWHVEGVGPEIKTVEDALHFRKPDALRNLPISDDGEDWYQQGDVCIWPQAAKAVKRYPLVLT